MFLIRSLFYCNESIVYKNCCCNMFVTGEDFQVLNEDRMQEKEDCVVDFAVCFAPAFSSLSLFLSSSGLPCLFFHFLRQLYLLR